MKKQKAKIAVKDLKTRKDVKGGTLKPTGDKNPSNLKTPTGGGGNSINYLLTPS